MPRSNRTAFILLISLAAFTGMACPTGTNRTTDDDSGDDDAGDDDTASLYPEIRVEPGALYFGTELGGGVAEDLFVYNDGEAVLIFDVVQPPKQWTLIGVYENMKIYPNGWTMFGVLYQPQEVGDHEHYLIINSNVPSEPQKTVYLSGTCHEPK